MDRGARKKTLDEIAALNEQIRFLTKVAIQANRHQAASQLAKLLDSGRNISVRVTIVGKPENGAAQVARKLAEAFGERLSTEAIEAADYGEVGADKWDEARHSAAIVCVVPAMAPLLDETQETLAREFGAEAEKLFVAIFSEDGMAEAIAPEVKQALSAEPNLCRATVSTDECLIANLEPFLSGHYLEPLLSAMRSPIGPSLRQLEPAVNAFAGFLRMDPAQFASLLEYIQRDLEALKSLGQQAEKTLQTQSQAALGGIGNQIVNLSALMRQKAEAVVQSAIIDRDVLSNSDARTRFGQELTSSARASGYGEFSARAQAIAMNLNTARSLLISSMEQIRDEAGAHVEELRANLGPELFSTLLSPPLDAAGGPLLMAPLDPGNKFIDIVTAGFEMARENIPDVPFSGWAAGRIESMFRSEMEASATSGWSLQTLDGPAAAVVAGIWQETAGRECGLLIGRIDALTGMVQAGLAELRLKALQIPKSSDARAKISRAFSEYAARLKQMREGQEELKSS